MGLGIVGDPIAHAGLEYEGSSVFELSVQLALDAHQDVCPCQAGPARC